MTTINQTGTIGATGTSGSTPGGVGGPGDAGGDSVYYLSATDTFSAGSNTQTGGAGGAGGNGGAGNAVEASGQAGQGGAGGDAVATTYLFASYTSGVTGQAAAHGGNGGSAGTPGASGGAGAGPGADGSTGGTAYSAAEARNGVDSSGSAYARAGSYGGAGGTGWGAGYTGGTGGIASVGSVVALAAGTASSQAIAAQTGGNGGRGYGGANGGAGASSTLTNAVSGVTDGGSLTLSQTATGGNGGGAGYSSSTGAGGAAGNASSSLTFDDSGNTTQSSTITASSTANGGGGGNGRGADGAAGGYAAATLALTGTGMVNAISINASGGNGGSATGAGNAGAGGAAAAAAAASATGGKSVTANASANGGEGGANSSGTGNGGAGGSATASGAGVSNTAGSDNVTVTVSASGGNGGGNTNGTGNGGAGGDVTGTNATATEANAAGGRAYARVIATGGAGGQVTGAGNTAGAGGVASGSTVAATGYSANAVLTQTGGAGGRGYSGAAGGAGGSSTLADAVSGTANGGYLDLSQTATGGNGGNAGYGSSTGAGGVAGDGGAASSALTVSDATANLVSASVIANGGTGGATNATSGGTGGSAVGSTSVSGVAYVGANVKAQGGVGGGNNAAGDGAAGGAATIADAAASSTATSLSASISAAATGGAGGGGTGAGYSGGAGGVASISQLVTASGQSATASVSVTGGAGGRGYSGAAGGTGASESLTDAVSGTATSSLSLSQTVTAGDGGYSTGGAGGVAGDASSRLTESGDAATRVAGTVGAYGGDAGRTGGSSDGLVGGSATAALSATGVARVYADSVRAVGGRGSGTITGTGGAGGAATASGSAASATTGSYSADAGGYATGGAGGGNYSGGNGGAGGAASGTSATATEASATGGTASANANAAGGTGGRGTGAGSAGGAGGIASGTVASATGRNASISVTQGGGAGGRGYSGADGGAGAASSLTNAVSGTANGGSLNLTQTANGGAGGYSAGGSAGGGAGGAASSALTVNDATANSINSTAQAMGGTGGGGNATIGGAGGDATASTSVNGVGSVNADATATGGAGGGVNSGGTGGAGGDATVGGASASTGSASQQASAYASASGGTGGRSFGAGSSGGAGGAASITGPVTASGQSALASASVTGGRGGNGYGGADGGAGARESLTNAVSGAAAGGTLTLRQRVNAGGGGYSASGNAGAGGAASSSLTASDDAASNFTASSGSYGGNGGTGNSANGGAGGASSSSLSLTGTVTAQSAHASGGSGGNSSGGSGGAGGAASSSAAGVSSTVGSASVNGWAYAAGGTGGTGGGGDGGDGGAVTSVTGSAIEASTSGGRAYGYARGIGGNGGGGSGAGNSGGVGGAVSGVTAYAHGFSSLAVTKAYGGSGGTGNTGADGGAGASVALANAVSGTTNGGTLTLNQIATGGGGGYSAGGTAGAAGAAQSTLTASDQTASSITVTVNAAGGAGGRGGDVSNGAAGGTGTAAANITGAKTVNVSSNANGGSGGNAQGTGAGGAGGNAIDSAVATTAGLYGASASATASGGSGGQNTSNGSGGAGGYATGSAVAQAANASGGTATANLTLTGGNGGQGTGTGNAGGAGGAVAPGVVSATGFSASTTVRVTGGSGGAGYSGAAAGAGASVSLDNAATATAQAGGSINQSQFAAGGSGGRSNTGNGGVAGSGTSVLTISDMAVSSISGNSRAYGGSGGQGINGAAGGDAAASMDASGTHGVSAYAWSDAGSGGSGGAGGAGGAGGSAQANSSATSTSNGNYTAYSRSHASAGSGGGDNYSNGTGGAGGDVTSVTAVATVTAPADGIDFVQGSARARAWGYGGAGGGANGSGGIAGAGGTATGVSAIASGNSAYAYAYSRGGAGGRGNASGGAGGAATLANAVDVTTTGGYEILRQIAVGGSGGAAQGAGANGGVATSTLTFNDNVQNAVHASSASVDVRAQGGSGGWGYSGVGGAGGGGYATAAFTGTYGQSISARATGGTAGPGATASGAGGNAVASAQGTATGRASNSTVTAAATGGSGATQGTAEADAAAQTAFGAVASASATASGSTATTNTDATTSYTGVVTGVVASTATTGGGSLNSESTVGVSTANYTDFYTTQYSAYAEIDSVPYSPWVNSTVFSGNTAVNADLGSGNSNAVLLGWGTMGAYASGSATGAQTLTASATFTLDASVLTGDLVLGLASPAGVDGFTSFSLTVTIGNETPVTYSFSDLADATSFFTNDAVDLGALTADEQIDGLTVTVAETMVTSTAGSRFANEIVLGATGGHGAPVITAETAQTIGQSASPAVLGFVALSESGTQTGESYTVTVSDTYGQFYVNQAGGDTVTGSGSNNVTITGSYTDVYNSLYYLAVASAVAGTDTVRINARSTLGGMGAEADIALTVNGSPVITAPVLVSTSSGNATPIHGISVSETGALSSETFYITLADTDGKLTIGNGSGAGIYSNGSNGIEIVGNIIAVNAALATLTDTDAASDSDVITVTAYDSLGSTATEATAQIAVTVAAAPVLEAPVSATVGINQPSLISGLSVQEDGAAADAVFTVVLADINGLLSAAASGAAVVSGAGTASLTISGTLDDVNATVATFTDAETTSANDTLTVNASDESGATAAQQSVALTVASAPQLTVPGSAILGQDFATRVSGVSFSEARYGNDETFTAVLTDASGQIEVGTNYGGSVTGNGTNSVTLTGTYYQVYYNLAYELAVTEAATGADTLHVTLTDSFGNSSGQQSISLTTNGAPVVTAPVAATVGISKATAITGVSVSETGNTSGETFTVTVSDTSGLLAVSSNPQNGSVYYQSSTSLEIYGTLAQVNAALANLTDTDASLDSDMITISVTDGLVNTSGSGDVSALRAIAVTVVNGPVITVAGTSTVGVGQAGTAPGISIAESGAQQSDVFTVTLADATGALDVTAASDDTLITGNDSNSVTITGSLADVNATLQSLTDTNGTVGADNITVNATDQFGFTAGTRTAAVNVAGAPYLSVNSSLSVGVGLTTPLYWGLSESYGTGDEMVQVVVSDTNGLLTANTGTGATLTGQGTTSLTIAGTFPQVQNALYGMTLQDSVVGSDTITIRATDGFGNGSGDYTSTVTVVGLPVLSVPSAITAGLGKAAPIAGVGISEAGASDGETIYVTLSDANGLLSLGSTTDVDISGQGGKTLEVYGALVYVKAALASLSDTDSVLGSDTISVTAYDAFGNNAVAQSIAVTVVNAQADAQPVVDTASPIRFGNVREGTTLTQAIALGNATSAGGMDLNVSAIASGSATVNGSVLSLAGGDTDDTDIVVGLNTGTSGVVSGTVTLSFEGEDATGTLHPASIASTQIGVIGTVYAEAAGTVTSTATVFHVGDAGIGTLVVRNTASGPYSEALIAAITDSAGATTATGGTGDIAPDATATLTYDVNTGTAGVQSGTIDLQFLSDGTGTDNTGTVQVGTESLPVSITIDNYATADVIASIGSLIGSGTNRTIDLGAILQDSAPLTALLSIGNTASGRADALNDTISVIGGSGFINSGLTAVDGIAAGAMATVGTITLPTDSAGVFTETLLVQTDGTNVSGYDGVLPAETITVTGTVLYHPLPELVVGAITAPSTALAGSLVPLTWTVTNHGDAAAIGPWSDEVFLASDAAGDDLVPLGQFSFSGTLAPGQSVTRTENVVLPGTLSGASYIVVRTDATDALVEHVSDSTKQTVDTNPTTIAPLPTPQITVTSVTPPAGAFSGQLTQVSWIVTNTGAGATTQTYWVDNVYLSLNRTLDTSAVLLASVPNPSYLGAGQSYQSSAAITLPKDIAGPYYVIIYADVSGQEGEHGGTEIITSQVAASSPFAVTASPLPDLTVSDILTPAQDFSGQPVSLSWTVTNTGSAATGTANWTDEILLSQDGTLDSSAIVLGTATHDGALAPGGSYVASTTVDLPVGISGDYTLLVVADEGSQVYEFGADHSAAKAITVNLTPPPDLVASVTSVPSATVTAHALTVSYAVTNEGSTPTPNAAWTDAVYLSATPSLGTDAVLLGSVAHGGALDVGQSYSVTQTFALPDGLSDAYYVIVQTDTGNAVFELDKTNDTAASTTPVTVNYNPVDLVVGGIKTASSAIAGHQIAVTYRVTNTGSGDTAAHGWIDELILSPTGTLGAADNVVLATVNNPGSLSGGGSYAGTLTADLPTTLGGNYQLFVVTDPSDTAVESNTANNASAGQTLQITELPNLTVSSLTAPSANTAGDTVDIAWSITNTGSVAATGTWIDTVYLSNNANLSGGFIALGTIAHSGTLAAGDTYTAEGQFTLPAALGSGNYYLVVDTDSSHQVVQVTSDDDTTSTIDAITGTSAGSGGSGSGGTGAQGTTTLGQPVIPTPPAADLAVSDVGAPTEVLSGQTITVSWTLTNIGNATTGTWYDEIYLSRNQTVDSTAVPLGTFLHDGTLAAGGQQSFTASFTVPPGLSGPYYVLVETDASSTQNDPDRTNNTAQSSALTVDLPAPIDLTVGTVDVTAAGSAVTVNYTIDNLATTAATGSWTDAIYLSADGSWSVDDKLLGYVTHSGGIAADGTYTATFTADLPGLATGAYHAIVRTNIYANQPEVDLSNDTGVSTGTIAASLPQLTLGTPATATLSTDDVKYYQITVDVNETLNFALTSDNQDAANDIYVEYGAVPTLGQFDATSTTPVSQNPSAVINQTQAGTYYVMVRESAGGNENVSLTVTALGYSITGITPDHGSNLGSVTLTISGARFNANEQVEIIAPDGTVRVAKSVDWVNSGELWATFDLTGLPVGVYTVKVDDAANSTTLADGFTVDDGPQGQLSVSLIAPSVLHTHSSPDGLTGTETGVVTIQYTNTGETDIAVPILDLTASDAEFADGTVGLLSSSEITVVGTSQSGPAGILQPGAEATIAYSFHGDFGYAQFISMTLALGTIQGSDSTIDWSGVDSFVQPPSIDSIDWSLIWQRFEAEVGDTAQGLVDALSDAATTLSQIGQATNDINTLIGYEIAQASGTLPDITLAQTTDISDSGTGLDLTLTRTYSASLLDRNAVGDFGVGWTFTYDVRAITDSSGDVSIQSGAGTEVFTLQSDGTYSGVAGDSATLTLANGGYVLTTANGVVEKFRPDGKLASITDMHGDVVTVGYGSNGFIDGVASSNGQSIAFTTNATGQIASATNGDGSTTTYTYDSTGTHLLSVSGPSGTTTYQYDDSGNAFTENALIDLTNPDGTTESFQYDSLGNLIAQSGTDGITQVTYTYDGPGKVTETDATGAATTYIYNANGQVAEVQDAIGGVIRITYDDNGNISSLTAADGSVTSFTYDQYGNLTSYTDPLGGTVKAAYVPGTTLLSSYTDGDGDTTDYTYDADGNLTGITYDDGTGTTYQYDADGVLAATTNARGQVTQYAYNTDGYLEKATFSDGTSQSYTYDAKGDVLSATAADGDVTTYTYNAAGQITSVTDPDGRVESYGYNALGQKIQRIEPDGSITNYSYTADGQLASLTDGNGNLIVDYTYNAAGNVVSGTEGNGDITTYAYDVNGNITHILTKTVAGVVTSQIDYTFDANNRPATETTSDGTWTYTYNAAGEVIRAVFDSVNPSIPDQDLSYAYDATGNRTQTIFNGAVTNYAANGLNQYVSVNGTIYSYDADGNLVSTQSGDLTTTYTYNALNQLISVVGPDSTAAYQYDAFGDRVSSTVNGVTTDYVIDPLAFEDSATGLSSAVAQAYDEDGSVTGTYDYGIGLVSSAGSSGTAYYLADATGNIVGVVGADGQLIDSYAYDPSGNLISASGGQNNSFLFSGAYGAQTGTDGLVLMGSRYYDSDTGRFLSRDPLGNTNGYGLYVYADNGAPYAVDPTGQFLFIVPLVLIGAAVGGIVRVLTAEPGESAGEAFLKGAASGAVGTLAGAAAVLIPGVGPVVAGAVAGAAGDVVNQLLSDKPFSWGQLATDTALGAALGGFGVGERLVPGTGGRYPNIWNSNAKYGVNGIKLLWREVADSELDGLTDIAKDLIKGVTSTDPNEMVGPAGYGPQGFIAASTTQTYTIDFENTATATAPAQTVVVTQQLDSNLDWRSFRLTGFSFDNLATTLSGNQAFYSGLLDYSATKGYDVQVTAGVNVATGVVTWTLQTIDPATGQAPQNPLLGFLPPDDAEGDGEGAVSYTIKAKSSVTTGETVAAQATVIFDTNAPIETAVVVNTLDSVAPTSQVQALAQQTDDSSFDVSWAGTDDSTGSGIANYTVLVSEDGAPPTVWLANTTQTNAIFTGDLGHTYAFSSIATDNAGNVEAEHATPDATIQVGEQPPVCFLAGTHILTDHGEVPVEQLAVGDVVRTLAGEERPIIWIGTGRVLATRGRRNAATPVIVRKGAMAENVPHRDLRITKAHSLFLDGVLIPVEFLVNHRSIVWDDHAQEVTIYHIELETHDILLADGMPAESYRDDGNRWLFQNANAGWHLPPQEPYAPVLTGGPIVDAAWRRLLDRVPSRPGLALTEEPRLHLLVDGRQIDPVTSTPSLAVFRVTSQPGSVRLVSRAASPQELGLARDPRCLGVALRQVMLAQGARLRVIEADDGRLTEGFHAFEAADGIRWTNGDATLPVSLFDGFNAPIEITFRLAGKTTYIDDGAMRRAG